MRVLFAASEVDPLIKTGGLADVAGHLPSALIAEGVDVRLILPAYRPVLAQATPDPCVAEVRIPISPDSVRLLTRRLRDGVTAYLVDAPQLFDRSGGPYLDQYGREWPDNAWRFTAFAWAVVQVAIGYPRLGWTPDIVHCNDWHTGLVPPLLSREPDRRGTVYTIHNLAYQGIFPPETFGDLNLPGDLWHPGALEFHDQLNFMKGGLVFADALTTVSPTYAREILTPEFGVGLEGVLQGRKDDLHGILNGVDTTIWDPARDPHLPEPFDAADPAGKAASKRAVQERLALTSDPDAFLLAFIGRLADQKGIDLILAVLPRLIEELGIQFAVLGSGGAEYEQGLRGMRERYPRSVGLYVGFNEGLAHLMEAGADSFLMPSRFEPCGLNQMYSLRYGTPPIVRAVGGLADTVVDSTDAALADGTANGFSFAHMDTDTLVGTVGRAVNLYRTAPDTWRRIMLTGMRQDVGWGRSAREYRDLYDRVIAGD